MRILIYKHNKNVQAGQLVEALTKGFQANGDEVRVDKSPSFHSTGNVDPWPQMVCILTLADRKIFDAYHRATRNILLIEPAFLNPDKYFRFALDGYQSWFMHAVPKPNGRLKPILDELGLEIQPYKKVPHDTVLYCSNPRLYYDWHGIADKDKILFDSNLLRHAEVRIANKGGTVWYKPDKDVDLKDPRLRKIKTGGYLPLKAPLSEAFDKTSVLVEHGGGFGVLATIAGLPVVTNSTKEITTAITPIAHHGIDWLYQNLQIPTNSARWQVLENIAWHQFTLEEIASGMAMEHLAPYTFKRIEHMGFTDLNDPQYLIEQYKLMHDMGNKFRGGLRSDLVVEITKLVETHKPVTLLDYGSGRGRQYESLNQQAEWGGIRPTCYDPGYLPFSKKPEEKFSGVICTDVAEHIPEAAVAEFLDDVIGYATSFVFFCIFTGAAIKSLPDGRNAHLTIKPANWWVAQIDAALKRRFTLPSVSSASSKDHITLTVGNVFEICIIFRGRE